MLYETIKEAEEAYSKYIVNHIKNVKKAFFEIVKDDKIIQDLGITSTSNIISRLEVHDRSKFTSAEFTQYREKYYPSKEDTTPPAQVEKYFEIAWEHHFSSNKHHPEFWTSKNKKYNVRCGIAHMDPVSIVEMLCDWISVDMTRHLNITDWWNSPNGREEKSEELPSELIDMIDSFIVRNASKLNFSKK